MRLIAVVLFIHLTCLGVWAGNVDYFTQHPELQAVEVFIGNFSADEILKLRYQECRLGKTAYTRDGKPLAGADKEKRFPIFVEAGEYLRIHGKLPWHVYNK
ncbi:MAG: hypothetical protein A3J76_03670 [Candidatus Moranbacteria bacterium RBG_13_45_13]|nr:MAG: hypothetical protein A3J76_03670 [Candidatus Moranbacteria bacterium RBG_13_45_13]